MVDLGLEQLDGRLTAEMDHLVASYFKVTPAQTDLPPYSFDWPMYIATQAAGKLMVMVARDEGALVGFALYFVMDHPHHKGFLVAECDTLSVSVDARNQGIGSLLLVECEAILRGLHVKRIHNRFRHAYTDTPLFEKHGFRPVETVFMKDL